MYSRHETPDRRPAPPELAESGLELELAADLVGDASLDSFPASDPPSWTGMRAGPPR